MGWRWQGNEDLATLSKNCSVEATNLTESNDAHKWTTWSATVADGVAVNSTEIELDEIGIDVWAADEHIISLGEHIISLGEWHQLSSVGLPIKSPSRDGGDQSSLAIRGLEACPSIPVQNISQAPILQDFDPRASDLPGETLQLPANRHSQPPASENPKAEARRSTSASL
jgi:hypothetical protein